MTGEPYEQMVRDADPYRPVGDVDDAARELLEQIVTEPTGRKNPFRIAAVAVAAAVVLAVVTVPQVWHGANAPAPSDGPASVAPEPSSEEPDPVTPVLEPAKVQKAADQGPRLVFGEPGWQVIHLEPFGERMGEMAYLKGEHNLQVTWFPAAEYRGRRNDGRGGAEKVSVGGYTGYLAAFGKNDFDVVTEPRDGIIVELRAGSNWQRDDFRTLLAGAKHVGVAAWIASVSAELTGSGQAGDRAARLLMDLPRPPNLGRETMAALPVGDIELLDLAVAKMVTCGWLTEWRRATAAGDARALTRAGNALLSSTDWKLLKALEAQGADLRQVITTLAVHVVNGKADDAEVRAYQAEMC